MNVRTEYAQTNVQLFNQLRAEGYSRDDRQLVFRAYEFGMRLFSGLFLPSGKPFIDHLVGTASILASLHMPTHIVSAGMIHAAYLHGDFGSGRGGITRARQQAVRNAVGEAVEEYVERYQRLKWVPDQISRLRSSLDELTAKDREVLLIRLVNEFEHHLDLGALYFAGKAQIEHKRYLERYGSMIVEMTQRLGFPQLAANIDAVFAETIKTTLPVEACIGTTRDQAYLVGPSSYRERRWIPPLRKLLQG